MPHGRKRLLLALVQHLLDMAFLSRYSSLLLFLGVVTGSAPVGLANPTGTVCFANSMLQALFHIPSLRQAVANYTPTGHEGPLFCTNINDGFKTAFQQLSAKAHNPENLGGPYNILHAEGAVNFNSPGDGFFILDSFITDGITKSNSQNLTDYRSQKEYVYKGITYPMVSPPGSTYFSSLAQASPNGSKNFVDIVNSQIYRQMNNFLPEEMNEIDTDRQNNGLEAIQWGSASAPQKVIKLIPNRIMILKIQLEANTGNCQFLDRSTIPLKITVHNKSYHLISAVLSVNGAHAISIVKTDQGWYLLDDTTVTPIDEAGVKERLKISRFLFYVDEAEVALWGGNYLRPASGGSGGESSGGGLCGSSGSGGPSGGSSGGGPSGSSSSGSNSGSSNKNASSRIAPSTPSKTTISRKSSDVSRPIYKSPMFIGCSVGALISVTVLAALLASRMRS